MPAAAELPFTDLPQDRFTGADKRQLRTLAISLSGAVGALIAVGVTIATGGAAAVCRGARTLQELDDSDDE